MSAARAMTQQLCHAITLTQFRAWLRAAAPGDEIVYARGPVIDQQRDVVVLARQFAADGRVTLTSQKAADEFKFTAVMLGAPKPEPVMRQPDPESIEGRVLRVLKVAANVGAPCPTNRTIARALRIEPEAARYQVNKLEKAGLITVEDRGSRVTRVVTIVATGKATSREMTPVDGPAGVRFGVEL